MISENLISPMGAGPSLTTLRAVCKWRLWVLDDYKTESLNANSRDAGEKRAAQSEGLFQTDAGFH